MCTGFTFCHARPRRPAAYGASSALTITPSCPAASASSSSAAASLGDGRSTPGIRCAPGRRSPAPPAARTAARRCRSAPSRCRQSKKNGRSSSSWLSAPNRLAVSWNGRGRPSSCSARVSPSSTTRRHGSAADQLDQLGHAVGHLAQRARPHPHRVAVAVHLDAGAVQLELDASPPRPARRARRPGSRPGLASIGRTGPADLGRDRRPAPRRRPSRATPRGLRQPARQDERAAHGRRGHVRRRGDRLQHHALQRALAQLAGEQPHAGTAARPPSRPPKQRARAAPPAGPPSRRPTSRPARRAGPRRPRPVRRGAPAAARPARRACASRARAGPAAARR